MINRQVYASRGTQNVPFFRTNLTLIPGLPAIATVSPGDIKVLTPPELAKESAEDVGVLPVESAVKPSEEVGDLSNVAAEISEVAPENLLSRLPEHALVTREQALSIEHHINHK